MGVWHFSESKVSNRSLPFVEALEPINSKLRKEKDRWLFDKASQRFRVRFLRVLGRFVNLAYLDGTPVRFYLESTIKSFPCQQPCLVGYSSLHSSSEDKQDWS